MPKRVASKKDTHPAERRSTWDSSDSEPDADGRAPFIPPASTVEADVLGDEVELLEALCGSDDLDIRELHATITTYATHEEPNSLSTFKRLYCSLSYLLT